jgi:hypothetical protein
VGLHALFLTLDEVRLSRGKGPWQWKGIEYVADTYVEDANDLTLADEG